MDGEFSINQNSRGSVKLRNRDQNVTSTFDTNRDRILIRPIEVKLNFVLDPKSLLLVLSRWPQIQRLEFWDSYFRFEKSFVELFCEVEWLSRTSRQRVISSLPAIDRLSLSTEPPPLPTRDTLICPDLVRLQVSKARRRYQDDREMKWWREMAERDGGENCGGPCHSWSSSTRNLLDVQLLS
jgi:hypothetical protein